MKKIDYTHLLFLVIVLGFLIWSAINPFSFSTWALETAPAIIGLICLLFTYRKFQFSTLSYFIITVLMVYTIIGGHYTYARMPLFDWMKDHFHLQRNYYDRVGHFLKGSIIIVMREFILKKDWAKPSKFLTATLFAYTLSIAALYEIAEWLAAKIIGRSAKDFLGTQGDVWDSEWDMALALVGAVVFLVIFKKITKNKF